MSENTEQDKENTDTTDNEDKKKDSGINLDATTKEQINQTQETIIARRDNSILQTRSDKYHYLAWLFVVIFIIWAIINASMFSFSGINMGTEFAPSQTSSNVFSMIIIIILVIISVLILNRMNSSHLQTNVKIFGK